MKLIDYLNSAKSKGFAIGAFNADNLEILMGIVNAGKNLNTPVMIEVSSGEVKYFGIQNLVAVVNNFKEELGLPIYLNLDHADDIEIIRQAIDLGFDLVHCDGSKLPYEENVDLTTQVVLEAHSKGVLVEGELDHFPGESEKHLTAPRLREASFTDSEKAREFVEKTGVDILAAFFGNVHGTYSEEERLDLSHLEKIAQAVPNTFLSLHGGSGVNLNDVATAVKLGVVKMNVNTELRVAFRETLENVLKGNPDEWAVYKLMPPVIEAVQEVVENKMKVLGVQL